MSNKELVMLVGLPRSGKSTWAKQQGIPIVNPDSIRLALHGSPFLEKAEPLVWVFTHYMIDSLFISGHDKIILDATNITRERRDQFYDKDYFVTHKVMKVPVDVCLERAREEAPILLPVIQKMAEQIEWPDKKEMCYASRKKDNSD